MNRKRLAIPWILSGITVIVCSALAVVIVVRDRDAGKQPASQNTRETSSRNFQDFSDYEGFCKGYYMRADSGVPFFLNVENSENSLFNLDTEDDTMFSELMNGDFIMLASDNEIPASDPSVLWVYKCVRVEKGTKARKSLPEIQEAIKEQEERFGYTFENYWRE